MKNFLLAFLGGGLGSIARYAISCLIGQNNVHTFPIATFISNVLACFIVGLVLGLVNEKQLLSPACKLFWTVGFCGGFSTFSAFSNESLNLFQQGAQLTSIIYILLSISLCMGAVVTGQILAKF